MPCHRASGGISCVVVGNDQPVYGIRVLAVCNTQCPLVNFLKYFRQGGSGYQLVVDDGEPLFRQPVHAFPPAGNVVFGVDKCERYPVDMALAYLVDILQRQRTGGEVARISIFLVAFHVELLEVGIADDGLSTNNGMAFVLYFRQYAIDSRC